MSFKIFNKNINMYKTYSENIKISCDLNPNIYLSKIILEDNDLSLKLPKGALGNSKMIQIISNKNNKNVEIIYNDGWSGNINSQYLFNTGDFISFTATVKGWHMNTIKIDI